MFWSKWGTLWNNVIHSHGNLPWYFAFCNNWVVTDLFDLIDLMNLVKLLPFVDIVDLLDLINELWTSFDKQLMNRMTVLTDLLLVLNYENQECLKQVKEIYFEFDFFFNTSYCSNSQQQWQHFFPEMKI